MCVWAGQFSSQAERRGALVIAKVISKSGCVHLEREDCDDQSSVSVVELQVCPAAGLSCYVELRTVGCQMLGTLSIN